MPAIITRFAKKYGTAKVMNVGFALFAGASVIAAFSSGYILLGLMIFLMFAQSCQEVIRDNEFYDNTKRDEASKYVGIYSTNSHLATFIAPLVCAGAIAALGGNYAVWIVGALMAGASFVFNIKRKA
ncbi:hypothetical protein FACS18945_3270 [Bacteroidia bacterium]|nr:hypothetical protein FACS18945_3270 [Bacteroidia bacterium]